MKLKELFEKATEQQGVTRAFKRVKGEYQLQYRCAIGQKKGKVVANPATCFKRKNLNRMVAGRAVEKDNRSKRNQKNIVTRKSAKSKRSHKWNRVLDPDLKLLSKREISNQLKKDKRKV